MFSAAGPVTSNGSPQAALATSGAGGPSLGPAGHGDEQEGEGFTHSMILRWLGGAFCCARALL